MGRSERLVASIKVTMNVWKQLNARKRLGQALSDVIEDLLEATPQI